MFFLLRRLLLQRDAPFSTLVSAGMVFVGLFVAFLAGFLSLALIEACAVFFFVKRLGRTPRYDSSASPFAVQAQLESSDRPHIFLKGTVWVAAAVQSSGSTDLAKGLTPKDGESRENNRKKGTSHDDRFETCPTKRYARLEDNVLTLVGDDSLQEDIDMAQWNVVAVSGGKEVSGKWAKKYPIKLEHKDAEFIGRNLVRLLYCETGWEKESWCQALRAASRRGSGVDDWYLVQRKEFQEYSRLLTTEYPAVWNATANKEIHLKTDQEGMLVKPDPMLTRKQNIWKKLANFGFSRAQTLTNQGFIEHSDAKYILLEKEPAGTHKDIDVPSLSQHGIEDDGPVQNTTASSMHVKIEKADREDTHDFL